MWYTLLIIVLAVLAVLGLRARKQSQAWGTPVCVVASIACIVLVGVSTVQRLTPINQGIMKLVEGHQEVQGWRLAQHIEETYPEARIAVLDVRIAIPENTQESTLLNTLLTQLKGEVGSLGPVQTIDLELAESDLYAFNPADLVETVSAELKKLQGTADIAVLNISSMPLELPNLSGMVPDGMKVILLGASIETLKPDFEAGRIIAGITPRLNSDAWENYRETPVKLSREFFDQFYLLVTDQNVDELSRQYENLFYEI